MLTDNDKGAFPLCGLVLDISNVSRFQGCQLGRLPITEQNEKLNESAMSRCQQISPRKKWQCFARRRPPQSMLTEQLVSKPDRDDSNAIWIDNPLATNFATTKCTLETSFAAPSPHSKGDFDCACVT